MRQGAKKSESGTALYYPFIHIRKPEYLKASLLYWDRVRRIVPDNLINPDGTVSGDDGSEIIAAAQGGVLLPTPSTEYNQAAEEMFFQKIMPSLEQQDFIQTFSVKHPDVSVDDRIHVEKMGYPVATKLEDLGLAKRKGEWITVRDELGNFYMHCLATKMSQMMGAPLFTDSPGSTSWGKSLVFSPTKGASSDELTDELIQLGIRLPSPEAMAQVPIEKLLRFHHLRAPERQRFRRTIEDILEKAASKEDRPALADYMADKRTEITAAIDDFRGTLDDLQVQAVNSIAKLTTPAAVTTLAGAIPAAVLGAPVLAAILTGYGLFLAGVSVYAETRSKLRQAKLGSPYYYLLSVEREIGVGEETRAPNPVPPADDHGRR
ncbi:MAG TPA: DUF6236 family protein [Thermoanaerobaculia bacterium]|nr:DUF6236 family protein [Thermoanaerobaculia bacterium]